MTIFCLLSTPLLSNMFNIVLSGSSSCLMYFQFITIQKSTLVLLLFYSKYYLMLSGPSVSKKGPWISIYEVLLNFKTPYCGDILVMTWYSGYIKFWKPCPAGWFYRSDIPLMSWHTCPALYVHCPMGSLVLPFGRIKIHFAIVFLHGIVPVGQQGLSNSWTSVYTVHTEWNGLISPGLLSAVHLCLFKS